MENSKLIILDRDGVINHNSDEHIKSPAEWVALPGSLEAIARLCREDYRVVVITNQSGIARGLFTINTLNKIHQKMIDELHHSGGEISAIFFCPHRAGQQCECRKPKPGMFLDLSKRLKHSLKNVYAVGDSPRDLQAACAAGARPIFIEGDDPLSDSEQLSQHDYESIAAVPKFKDLSRFVDNLLSTQS